MLRICQEFIHEASSLTNKTLLNSIYDHIIFDFRIWNKAEYEIRIGHIQYISTIIKDDKKYFRKKYGIQFFLDIIKTYFGTTSSKSQASFQTTTNENYLNPNYLLAESNLTNNLTNNQTQSGGLIDDEDLRNLRNSFFGLIKYYAQKEIKINEVNAMISFLSTTTRNTSFQNDLLDVLISLLEAPNSTDQLYLLLYEPNIADGFYSLLVQTDLNEQVQKKIIKLIRILLKTKKVYDKSKSRLRLEDCGTYAGLVSKLVTEYSHYSHIQSQKFNENLPIDLLENFLLEETAITNYDNLWHILSLLNQTPVALITDMDVLIKTRLKACEIIVKFIFTTTSSIRLLTKTPAWQGTICQLFCIDKRVNQGTKGDIPPIVVSASSYINNNNDDDDVEENEDEWENLDMNTSDVENGETSKVVDEKQALLTSTPSRENKKKNRG